MQAPRLANSLWSLACLKEARAFHRGLGSVEREQRAYLRGLLARNRDCAYGRSHGFGGLAGAEAFRDRVPLIDYAEAEPWIRRAALGESALTAEPVLLLEPTGGSQGGSKFIPYTASLRREFGRGLAPWIRGLFARFPGAARGRAYWSISPPLERRPPFPATVPAGFAGDAEYLGPLGRLLESQVLAVPSEAVRERDPDAFFDRTALLLLACRDLALVSVWNPTFFSLLLDRIRDGRERYARALHDGGRPGRARLLEGNAGDPDWTEVWPRLELISCWRDGWARGPAERLAARFPGVALQAKGLLATEAFVSFPWHPPESAPDAPPLHLLAYRSHFFEFVDVESGKTRFAWETETGATYSVAVTTGGGLYRYRLRDRVRIEGFRGDCPVLAFLAKEDSCSDLTGEKLQADFVQACAEAAFREAGMAPAFWLVAPEPDASPPRYALYVGEEGGRGNGDALERGLEAALRGNFQYEVSRRLGQLGPARVVPVGPGAEAEYYYYKGRRAKLGDVKWKPLEIPGPWEEVLRPVRS